MRIINWIFRVVLFIALLGLALKNVQPVKLSYFFGFEWQTYLVIVLLIFFSAGVVIGVLGMLTNVVRLKHEISVLKRDIRAIKKQQDSAETQPPPG